MKLMSIVISFCYGNKIIEFISISFIIDFIVNSRFSQVTQFVFCSNGISKFCSNSWFMLSCPDIFN